MSLVALPPSSGDIEGDFCLKGSLKSADVELNPKLSLYLGCTIYYVLFASRTSCSSLDPRLMSRTRLASVLNFLISRY